MAHPSRVELAFQDMDQFCDAVRDWDVDFRQLSGGRCHANLVQQQLGPLLFASASLSQRADQRGTAPQDLVTLAIPATQDFQARWLGQDVGSDDVMIYAPGGPIECTSEAGFEILTVSVAPEHLSDVLMDLDPSLLERGGVIRCGTRIEPLRRALLRWRAGLGREAHEEAPSELLRALPAALAGPQHPPIPGGRTRDRALALALELIEYAPDKVGTVAGLARWTAVSERTLLYAFRERFGVSPKQFLRARRLLDVRRDLLRADPATATIAGVAGRSAFWHMGQFARDYRLLFGESPSRTLQRARA